MGILIIPTAGTENGPCNYECGHIKCQKMRYMANKICPFCKEPIGYERGFYKNQGRLFHIQKNGMCKASGKKVV